VKKNFETDKSDKIYTDMSEKILELISKNKNITIKELSEKIDVSSRSIERNIKKLQDDNKLKRIGGYKGGYWEII
jgi:predicted HTH transcriptional regulator